MPLIRGLIDIPECVHRDDFVLRPTAGADGRRAAPPRLQTARGGGIMRHGNGGEPRGGDAGPDRGQHR